MSPSSSLTSSDTSSPSSNAASADADDERSESDSGVLASPVWKQGLFGQLFTPALEEKLRTRLGVGEGRQRYEAPVREARYFQYSVAKWAESATTVLERADFEPVRSAVNAVGKLKGRDELLSFFQAVTYVTYCLLLEAVVNHQQEKTSSCPLTIKPIMSEGYLEGFIPVLSIGEEEWKIPSYSFVLEARLLDSGIIEPLDDLIRQVWKHTQEEMDGIRGESKCKQQSEHSDDDKSTDSEGSRSDDDSGPEWSNDGRSNLTSPVTSPEMGSSDWGQGSGTDLSKQTV